MKRLTVYVSAGLAAVVLCFVAASCGPLAGPPVNLQLGADSTGLRVMVVWTSPAEGPADRYRVYFASLSETTFGLVADTTATSFVHDPHDSTGSYTVAAVFSGTEYFARDTLSTVPVHTDTTAVAELDASGNSGYGWNRTTGAGRTVSMLKVENTGLADFYVTDFMVGSNRLPYAVASPSKGPSDPAGLVPPSDAWRINGFTDPRANEHDPLPPRTDEFYFYYTDVVPVPCLIGCSTQDGYFGLVKVVSVDRSAAEARVVSWFQTVPGLRLMMHENE